ncbi:MAG: AraC family transcriptional regulator [Polyangiaceae bacterium]
MYLAQAAPADLAPWVDCVWSLSLVSGPGWGEVAPADLHGDLVLSLGGPFGVGDSGASAGSCWLGPRSAPLRFRHSAGNQLFGIRFKPGGAAAFFGMDARALVGWQTTGSATPWTKLLDVMAQQLDAGRPELRGVWGALRSVDPSRCVSEQRLLGALEHQLPGFRVAAFARQLGLTERTLQRRCLSSFGVGPKLLHRIRRAQAARDLLDRDRPGAEIAHRLGFVDQAHLCNELRALQGTTPTAPRVDPVVCRISPSRR